MERKREWTLAGYRAFNDELARRLEVNNMNREREKPPSLESFVERGRAAQADVDKNLLRAAAGEETDMSDLQATKLFVSQLHRVAATLHSEQRHARDTLFQLADALDARWGTK